MIELYRIRYTTSFNYRSIWCFKFRLFDFGWSLYYWEFFSEKRSKYLFAIGILSLNWLLRYILQHSWRFHVYIDQTCVFWVLLYWTATTSWLKIKSLSVWWVHSDHVLIFQVSLFFYELTLLPEKPMLYLKCCPLQHINGKATSPELLTLLQYLILQFDYFLPPWCLRPLLHSMLMWLLHVPLKFIS
jgi:hypothetical protein